MQIDTTIYYAMTPIILVGLYLLYKRKKQVFTLTIEFIDTDTPQHVVQGMYRTEEEAFAAFAERIWIQLATSGTLAVKITNQEGKTIYKHMHVSTLNMPFYTLPLQENDNE